ncbi:MAG: hypothetical protein ACLP07_06630 [Terracidiphilus sp.]
MGSFLSVGTVAFVAVLILSVPCFIALIGCWAIGVPEFVDGEITRGGKMLRRAKYSFTAACVLILISLLLDTFVRNPANPSELWWIWDTHPRFLILLLILSSGLSVAASYFAFQSKGDGRWVLWSGGPIVAALALIAAFWIGQLI